MLQNMYHKLHRRVVVIQHDDLVHRRLLGTRPRFEDYLRLALVVVCVLVSHKRSRAELSWSWIVLF